MKIPLHVQTRPFLVYSIGFLNIYPRTFNRPRVIETLAVFVRCGDQIHFARKAVYFSLS